MSKLKKLRKALDWLAFTGLDDIDWTLSVQYDGSVALSIGADKLSVEERIEVKHKFGPLKARITDYARNLEGERKLDEKLKVTVCLSDAYICEELKPDDISEKKWDDLRDKIKRGELKIRDCKPTVGMRAGE